MTHYFTDICLHIAHFILGGTRNVFMYVFIQITNVNDEVFLCQNKLFSIQV